MLMPNRYASLVGSNKIRDEYQKINIGFDRVQQEIDAEVAAREALDQRVDTIIQGGGPDKDAELVDIRTPDPSYTPGRAIAVAGDVVRDMQEQITSNRIDVVQRSINVKYPPATLVAAKGDGVTDDASAIQAIIDYVAQTGGYADIFFPAGDYLIRSSLVIPTSVQGIRLLGCGIRSKLTLGFDGNLIVFEALPSGLALSHHKIKNLCFVGNGRISGDLIHVEYVSDLYIENCIFFGLTQNGNAIYVAGNPNDGQSSHDIFIRDNYFDSNNQPGNAGLYLDTTAADIQLSRNIMELRHTVNYGLYIRDCGSLQSFDNHYYNCKINVLKIDGSSGKHYMFDNDFIDNAYADVVHIDGTNIAVANGSISFKGCLFMSPGSGYSYICLVDNVYNVSIVDCAFPIPSEGARSAIRAVNSANVNDIVIERNTFINPSGYTNGVIENLYSFRCVIQNNNGYKKTVTGTPWFNLNQWCEYPEQSAGIIYLSLYTIDSSDGEVIVHYREGTSGTDFIIYTKKISASSSETNSEVISIPVSPNANIRVDATTNVSILTKSFVPFNV